MSYPNAKTFKQLEGHTDKYTVFLFQTHQKLIKKTRAQSVIEFLIEWRYLHPPVLKAVGFYGESKPIAYKYVIKMGRPEKTLDRW